MARRQMNLVDLLAWLRTTGEALRGAHVSNVYYDKPSGIVLVKLRGGRLLVLEPGRRAHLTSRMEPPKEFKPDPLVVLARKHLRGDRIESLGLVGGDRILEVRGRRGYRLVAELVPRGVVALVDPSGTLLAATQYLKVKDRSLAPKKPYEPPPPRPTILEPSPDQVLEALEGEERLVPPLVRKLGVPAEVAEEALYRAGLGREGRVGPGEAEALAEAIREVVGEALSSGRGYLVLRGGAPVEASPFRPTHYLEEGAEIEEKPSLDEALDTLFSRPPGGGRPRGDEVEAERARLLASLEKARETAEAYRRRAEELRRAADYVARNYGLFQRLLYCMARHRGDPGEVEACSGVPIVSYDDKGVVVEVEGLRIRVPWGTRAPEKLVALLFREAGVYESKAERALEAQREVEEKLSELMLRSRARSLARLYRSRRRAWYERFHWTITRSGLLAVGGRDASQNELLVRRYLEPGDYFMHADIHGAPAVVVKAGGREPSVEDMLDAAVIAVGYSKAWKAGLGAVRAYYVPAGQVSLSPPSGEYLAKGGIMVYGRKNWLPPVPVRVYLGIALDPEGVPLVLVGSEEVVARHSIAYATLSPGDEARIEVARRLKQEFTRLLPRDEAHIPLAVPDEDIAHRIPGKARITGVKRGRGEPFEPPE